VQKVLTLLVITSGIIKDILAHPHDPISKTKKLLLERLKTLQPQSAILRAKELRDLYSLIPTLPEKERGAFGKAVNELKNELETLVSSSDLRSTTYDLPAIDVTAPFDVNATPERRPQLLPTEQGTIHPLMRELDQIIEIFARMGFASIESRQLDDDYHMFTSLNFPEDHPARDDYDTFVTVEKDWKAASQSQYSYLGVSFAMKILTLGTSTLFTNMRASMSAKESL
jgi:phenylalanyl-tRNA synthetase alpha subunit